MQLRCTLQKRGERDASRVHSGGVNAAIVSQDGRLAVTLSKDCTARVWDLETGTCRHVLVGECFLLHLLCVLVTAPYMPRRSSYDLATHQGSYTDFYTQCSDPSQGRHLSHAGPGCWHIMTFACPSVLSPACCLPVSCTMQVECPCSHDRWHNSHAQQAVGARFTSSAPVHIAAER